MEKKVKLISKRILAFVLTFAMMLVIMPSISASARAYEDEISAIRVNVSNYDRGKKISDLVITVPEGEHYSIVRTAFHQIGDFESEPYSTNKVIRGSDSLCIDLVLEAEDGYYFKTPQAFIDLSGVNCDGNNAEILDIFLAGDSHADGLAENQCVMNVQLNFLSSLHLRHHSDCVYDLLGLFRLEGGMHLYIENISEGNLMTLAFGADGEYMNSIALPQGMISKIYNSEGTEISPEIGQIYVLSVEASAYLLYLCPSAYIFDEDNPDGGNTPAPEAKPDMNTVNIEGATFNTWEEITANTPNLTAEKLQKVNASNDDLLHVNIVGKEDKTVPATAVAAMEKSSIGGLHVFIGESDAVTFLNNIDYSKYTGMNFKHEDEVTENSRTIDFTSKGKLNAVLVFHTLIAPDKKAYVYKVVDGKEVLVGTASSNSNGGFCFAIDELAEYVIKY